MNVVISSPNSMKSSKKVNVFKTPEYEDFLDRANIETYSNYIKNNQGKTIEEISEHFNEDQIHVETIMKVWVEGWTTFFRQGTRIVVSEEKYYCLSPRNPTIRKNNPQFYNY